MTPAMEQLLHARDVAGLLGLTASTVLDRFEAGDIPGFRLYGRKGGPVRFRVSEIERWLDDVCRVGTVPPDNHSGPAPPSSGPAPAPRKDRDAQRILRPLEPS